MTGPGRPSTGVRVAVRIPAAILDDIDHLATQHDTTRADVMRAILTAHMAGGPWQVWLSRRVEGVTGGPHPPRPRYESRAPGI